MEKNSRKSYVVVGGLPSEGDESLAPMLASFTGLERDLQTRFLILRKHPKSGENVELILQLSASLSCREGFGNRNVKVSCVSFLGEVVLTKLVLNNLKIQTPLLTSKPASISIIEQLALQKKDGTVGLLAFEPIDPHDSDLFFTSTKFLLEKCAKLSQRPLAEDDSNSVGRTGNSLCLISHV